MSQRKQVRDPMKTKTGKTRLGGLTVTQLTALADKEGRKKNKAKILNRIRIVTGRKGSVEKVVVATTAE
jgi:hypothetical protein